MSATVSKPNLNSAIGLLSLNHMLSDAYANFLPQLLPFLVAATGMSIAKATALVSVYSVASSVTQPAFGYLGDRKGQTFWINIGTLWMALSLSLTGVVTNYGVLLLIAVSAGIGSAAFHPQAYSFISSMTETKRGTAVSAFMSVGNLGFAAAPLVFIPLFTRYGIHASVYIAIPAAALTIPIFLFLHPTSAPKRNGEKLTIKKLKEILNQSAFLFFLVSLCAMAETALLALLPMYFKYNTIYSNHMSVLLFGFFIACALGQVSAGYLSDRFGRRTVIICCLLLSAPLLFGFVNLEGPLGYVLLLLGGMSFMAFFPVSLVLAHEMNPDNKAIASGMFNGVAMGIGGLAAVLLGGAADAYGLAAALAMASAIPLTAGLLALRIRNDVPVPPNDEGYTTTF